MAENAGNLHKEHRKRVKERFLRDGFEHFSPHEVLELILFYALPQKDTNVLAHRLIERFGSLSRVFRAPREELMRVEGMGEHAATLLKLWMPAASYVLTQEAACDAPCFNSVTDVGQYFVNLYAGAEQETVYLMLLDNRNALLSCVRVSAGSVNSVGITPRRLIELALRQNAACAILAHNHPLGIAVPSSEDINTTSILQSAFSAVGISLLEHILVAGGRWVPIMLRSRSLLKQQEEEKNTFYANYSLDV